MLSENEINRYSRHILLPEIGGVGQAKLKTARVLVIGAGGLGCPLLQYLAASGVGTIGVCDDDVVSLSNLQRQVLFETADIGLLKVEVVKRRLEALNPHVQVRAYPHRFTPEMLSDYDILVDGSDNFTTRYLAADSAEAAKKPLITAAVGRFDASITTLKPYEKNNPSYRCLFPEKPAEGIVPACAEAGIIGALTGVIGAMMAHEVVKEIAGYGENLVGKLLMIDLMSMRFETIAYERASVSP
jgi:molybdopterin-synthase adenylyltransferase